MKQQSHVKPGTGKYSLSLNVVVVEIPDLPPEGDRIKILFNKLKGGFAALSKFFISYI